MFTLFSLVAQLATPAHAQVAADWSIHPDVLLTGADVPFGQSIGSPSVVYDSINNRYFMLFETRLPATDPDCPAGQWAIGRATSPDGLNWTVAPTPLISPDPNAASPTFHSCVAAHPGAIFETAGSPGGSLYVYFKGEQADDACDVTAQPWGCGQYTGIGVQRIRFNANGSIRDVTTPSLVINTSDNIGYPKVIRTGRTYLMSFTRYPNIVGARSEPTATGTPQPLGPFVEAPNPLLSITAQYALDAYWVEDEFFNSALACRNRADAAQPVESFVGGRDTNFGIVVAGGLGKAMSQFGAPGTWSLDLDPQFGFVGDSDFRHWDVLRVGAAPNYDYLLWFSERDAGGNNQIRLATTLPSFSWSNTDVYGKSCN